MTVTFNAFEIFEIAEQIERNGANFYIRAAELFDDTKTSQMFLNLAEWEKKHEETFTQMKDKLSEQNLPPSALEPEDSMPSPRVFAGLAVFGIRSDPAKKLHGTQNRTDILRKAVESEKDSIVFYQGLKGFVVTENDKETIDGIIKEELKHIVILDQALKEDE